MSYISHRKFACDIDQMALLGVLKDIIKYKIWIEITPEVIVL